MLKACLFSIIFSLALIGSAQAQDSRSLCMDAANQQSQALIEQRRHLNPHNPEPFIGMIESIRQISFRTCYNAMQKQQSLSCSTELTSLSARD